MKYAVRAAAVLGVAILAVGCYHQDDNNLFETGPVGGLRMVHGMAEGPTLIFSIGGIEVATLEFARSFPVVDTAVGDVSVDVSFTDPVTLDQVDLLTDVVLTTAEGRVSTLVLHGTFASPLAMIIDTALNELDAGASEVEVQYANVSQGSVDIYLTDAAEPLAAPSQTLVSGGFSDSIVGTASDNFRLRVTPENDPTVIYDSDVLALVAGVRSFIMVHESFGPRTDAVDTMFADEFNTVTLPNVVDTGAIRALNAVADETSVDVEIADQDTAVTLFADSLLFEQISAFIETDPTIATAEYSVASDPGNVALQLSNLPVSSGAFHTFVTAGSATNQTLTGVFSTSRDFRPTAMLGRVSFINASESAGEVDIYFLDPGELPEDNVPGAIVAFKGNFQGELAAGPTDLYLLETQTTNVLVGPVQLDIASLDLLLFYITDAVGGGTPVRFNIVAETPP